MVQDRPEVCRGQVHGSPNSDCKLIEIAGGSYYGTVAEGFTIQQVINAADKVVELLDVAGKLGGDLLVQNFEGCVIDYKADILLQFLPKCSAKCRPLLQCKTSCDEQRKCVPKAVNQYFPLLKKGSGKLRSLGLSIVKL